MIGPLFCENHALNGSAGMFSGIMHCCTLMAAACCALHLQILDELYHEDKGFNNNYTVLLSERPPSHDVEHALATHSASKKISFLQGSPFRAEVGRGYSSGPRMSPHFCPQQLGFCCCVFCATKEERERARGVAACPATFNQPHNNRTTLPEAPNLACLRLCFIDRRTGAALQRSTPRPCSSSRQNTRRIRPPPTAT